MEFGCRRICFDSFLDASWIRRSPFLNGLPSRPGTGYRGWGAVWRCGQTPPRGCASSWRSRGRLSARALWEIISVEYWSFLLIFWTFIESWIDLSLSCLYSGADPQGGTPRPDGRESCGGICPFRHPKARVWWGSGCTQPQGLSRGAGDENMLFMCELCMDLTDVLMLFVAKGRGHIGRDVGWGAGLSQPAPPPARWGRSFRRGWPPGPRPTGLLKLVNWWVKTKTFYFLFICKIKLFKVLIIGRIFWRDVRYEIE